MIQLYAITDHSGPPLPSIGQLRTVTAAGLAAVCAPAQEGELTAESLWRFEHVVEALMHDRDVLPVRYGTRAPDDAAVVDALEAGHDQLAQTLDFVRGAVEVAVRVVAVDEQPPRPERIVTRAASNALSGTEYLRTKAREAAHRSDAAQAIHEPLAAFARAHAKLSSTVPGELLRAAYLVSREELDAFVGRVGELQDENPGLGVACTGPWPPYSFSDR